MLPSNSSYKYFADNNAASYKTQLPRRIVFDPHDSWEVAVTEIMYPKTWYNVKRCELWFYILENRLPTDTIPPIAYPEEKLIVTPTKLIKLVKGRTTLDTRPIIVPGGYLESPTKLIALFNSKLDRSQYQGCKISYNEITSKASIKVHSVGTQRILPAFDHDTSFVYGFENILPSREEFYSKGSGDKLISAFTGTWVSSGTPVDMNAGYHILFLNSDIVEHSIIGDYHADVLRCIEVPNDKKFGEMCVVRYVNPQYRPVRKRDFDTIEVNITDSTGTILPLEFGTSVVTLDFRHADG